ncbi:MAG: single-stranded DNA-binding protein [Bacteroidales bacterium]|nr:single-stranded DNA-binding protein [Bacteroidales bacterium]
MNSNTINRVELQGRIGTVRIYPVGEGVAAAFSLQTDHILKDSTGQPVCETVWHHVSAFQSQDVCLDGLSRGVLVHVDGRLRASRYTAADGTERVFTEVVASSLKVIEE